MNKNKIENFTCITEEQYASISKNGKLNRELRKLLNIAQNKSISIGDTVVSTESEVKKGDVLKYKHGNNEVFYIVIEPLDEQRAFCYSIY